MRKYIKCDIRDLSSESVSARMEIASDPNTRPHTLAELANATELSVRAAVASNPNTPADILAKMYANPITEGSVLHELGKNPNLPKDILNKYLKNGFVYWRAAAAVNPSISVDDMYRFANDDPIVQKSLASNPNLPVEVMEILAECGNDLVLQALIDNPNTPDRLQQTAVANSGLRIHFIYFCEGISWDNLPSDHVISEVIRETVQNSGGHYRGCDLDDNDPDCHSDFLVDVFTNYISDEAKREYIEFRIAEALESAFGWDASTHSNDLLY